ncbi:MAG TPA: PaaI family thioesterase [Micromonosporaceae bacterium]|jgi:uncharacterized protein (TIGR00369 family)|nr:PaaI family thioesterase [Micromonosporaceae bacterium]
MTEAATEAASARQGVATDPDRTRTYGWHDPMALADAVAGLSGLELFEKLANGELPVPPIADTLSFGRIEATGAGSVTLSLEPNEFHFNPLGSMHGGVISAVLDTAAGCSVHTTLPVGIGYTSLDLHVRFLRPVTLASGTLRCDGRVISKGRQTALAESHLHDAAGKLVAHATSTCLIFPLAR